MMNWLEELRRYMACLKVPLAQQAHPALTKPSRLRCTFDNYI